MNPDQVRIDKWLWAVRLYKTRTLAAEACKAGHVRIDDHPVKPARFLKVQEVITTRKQGLTQTVRVLALLERRVSASAAKEFCEDLTPPEEYQKAREVAKEAVLLRPKGLGRPRKKDRRQLDRLLSRE